MKSVIELPVFIIGLLGIVVALWQSLAFLGARDPRTGIPDMAGSLAISNLDQGETALRVGRSLLATDTSDQCKLVFHKFGNRYYLAQIWTPGYKAWEVVKSKEERSLEREMRTVKNFKPEPVVLAARIE